MDESLIKQTNKQIELLQLSKQYFLKKKDDLSVLGEYVILLAKLEKISLTKEEETQILKFYQNQNDPFFQEELFGYLEYGKYFNFLNVINCTSNFFKKLKSKPASFFTILRQANKKIDQEHLEEIIDNNNFKYLICFNQLWTHFLKKYLENNEIPSKLIEIFEKISKQGFTAYQEYLEYLLQISFTISQEEKSLGLRSTLTRTLKKSFYSPLDEKLKDLQKKKDEYERNQHLEQSKKQKKEQKKHKMNVIFTKNENSFIFITPKIKKYLKEAEPEVLPQIIAHNEIILNNYEQQILKLKQELNDEYITIFLDLGLPLPPDELLNQLKQVKSIEELKKILKVLTKKEYSFLTPNHPAYLDTIQNTSEKTLKEISKEIQESQLSRDYIKIYPQILFNSNWEQYKQNKDLILQQNLELSFFQNSDILLYPSEHLLQIINLINTYYCTQLPFYHLAYFDEIDELIETRFDSNFKSIEMQNNSTIEVKEILNNQIPLCISHMEEEPEINWLDEQFEIDPSRYLIHGIVISRFKVLRYFKALNEKNGDRKQNLLHAIFYNTPLFEFEITEIAETLTGKTKQKKNDFSN